MAARARVARDRASVVTRRVLWGAVVVTAYLGAAFVSRGDIVPRPLYDGLAPPSAYRYASPPPDLAATNEEPEPGQNIVELEKKGSQPASISTGDGQMQIVLPEGTFEERKGEDAVDVRIVPSAPRPPLELDDGLRVDGNAYAVTAEYTKSQQGAEARGPITVVLRYPSFGSVVVRRAGNRWTSLETQVSQASLQLFAESDALGVFATAGTLHTRGWTRFLPYIGGGLGVLLGVLGYLSGRRGWFRKHGPKRKPTRKRTATRRRR